MTKNDIIITSNAKPKRVVNYTTSIGLSRNVVCDICDNKPRESLTVSTTFGADRYNISICLDCITETVNKGRKKSD